MLGLLRNVIEIVVMPKSSRRQLITIGLNGTPDFQDYRHILLRVELTGGEEYAIDLSGAQYGYYEPITPWNVYRDTRVANIVFIPIFAPEIGEPRKQLCCRRVCRRRDKFMETFRD
jgi:hypothetical protein